MIARALAGAVVLLGLVAGPAVADDDLTPVPEPQSIDGTATPNVAAPGDAVVIQGTGWPATTQVQAVVCGDLAIGGSSTCAQQSAVLGYVNDEGLTSLSLVVAAPPKPCPCVIRLSSFNGAAVAVDIPFVVAGHPVGTPPAPTLPSPLLTVSEVELSGGAGFWPLFGASATRELVLEVRNDGDAPAVNPQVQVGVGKAERDEDLDTELVDVGDLTLNPGETATLVVEVTLPAAAFGTYRVVGDLGSAPGSISDEFSTTWTAYPWGLVALNLLGLTLLVLGIRRRLDGRSRARRLAAADAAGVQLGATPGLEVAYALPDVVYVPEVGGFLVSPRMAGRSGLFKRVTGRIDLKDLAALGMVGTPGTPMLTLPAPGAPVDDAVVDLSALEAHLARLAESRGRASSALVPAQVEDAVVDLEAVDTWFSKSRTRVR